MAAVKRYKNCSTTVDIQYNQLVDRNNLTQLFPEEIWTLIFQHHSSSVDLRNVVKASKYFKSLLAPLRTQWLFSFVWQLIAAKSVIKDRDQYTQWIESLLTLRFVCKTWSTSVDRTFERVRTNYLHMREIGIEIFALDFGEEYELYVPNRVCPRTKARLDEFVEYFDSTHPSTGNRCPLISKTINVTSDSLEISYAHSSWNTCLKILSTYGRFFRHCTFAFKYYEHFCQLLEFLPNLHTLQVIYKKDFNAKEYPTAEIAKWPRHSPPQFSNIKFLDVQCAPPNIVHALVSKFKNISGFRYMEAGFDITGLLAHPLQRLQIFVNLTSCTTLKTGNYSWPLTELELCFEKNCFVEWPELFGLLHQNWNKTMKWLKISLPGTRRMEHMGQIVNWSLMPLLNLQKLTHLSLVMDFFHTLDFILPLSGTLEYLSLQFNYELENVQNDYEDDFQEIKGKKVIKYMDFVKDQRPMDSNIWTLFPNLKEVKHNGFRASLFGRVFQRPRSGNF